MANVPGGPPLQSFGTAPTGPASKSSTPASLGRPPLLGDCGVRDACSTHTRNGNANKVPILMRITLVLRKYYIRPISGHSVRVPLVRSADLAEAKAYCGGLIRVDRRVGSGVRRVFCLASQ